LYSCKLFEGRIRGILSTRYELVSVQGSFAPTGTPLAVVARLNREIVPFLRRPDTKEKFFAAGVESLGSTPEELEATVKSEMARLGKVISPEETWAAHPTGKHWASRPK